jgi:hypothetical protein
VSVPILIPTRASELGSLTPRVNSTRTRGVERETGLEPATSSSEGRCSGSSSESPRGDPRARYFSFCR